MTLILIILIIAIICFFLSPFCIWIKVDSADERCWIVTSDGEILPAITRGCIDGQYYIVETIFDLCKVKKIYKTYMEAKGG